MQREATVKVILLGPVGAGKASAVALLDSSTSLEEFKAELEGGSTAHALSIQTLKNLIQVCNLPGHRNFAHNLLSGSAPDAAVLFVSAVAGEFETSFTDGGQTKAQLQLVALLGVGQLVVVINKMDATADPWSQERFDEIVKSIGSYLDGLGFHLSAVTFVPVSALLNQNVKDKGSNLGWWAGPTLVASLNQLQPSASQRDQLLRVTIEDMYNIGGGVGWVAVGRVQSGTVQPGIDVTFALAGTTAKVKALEMRQGGVTEAVSGDRTGFSFVLLTDAQAKTIRRGDVCGYAHKDPPHPCSSFVAQIAVVSESHEIRAGDNVTVQCHNAQVECCIKALQEKVCRRTGASTNSSAPEVLKVGSVAKAVLVPLQPMCVDAFAKFPELGKVRILIDDVTVAIGMIKSALK